MGWFDWVSAGAGASLFAAGVGILIAFRRGTVRADRDPEQARLNRLLGLAGIGIGVQGIGRLITSRSTEPWADYLDWVLIAVTVPTVVVVVRFIMLSHARRQRKTGLSG